MSRDLLGKFIVEYMKLFSGRLFFIWHGGEPLLAGIDFFQQVIDLQKKNTRKDQTIKNAIQTNATLINDDWARFFKNYHFKVGISLDGSRESHDRFRVDRRGKGSFEHTLRGLEILKRNGIRPGVIQTMTCDNAKHVKKDLAFFFEKLGIKSLATNIYLDPENNNQAMINQGISNEEVIRLIKTCIHVWLERDDSVLRIREIENFISGALNKRASGCSFNGSCTGYFCLDHDGKIYPCDRFSGRSDLLFGDISKRSLLEILNGSARLKYAQMVNTIHSDCISCEWWNACHNGCSHHRIDGLTGKYYYCKAREVIFVYLKRYLARYLNQQKEGVLCQKAHKR